MGREKYIEGIERDRRMRGGWRETGQERWRSGFRFIFSHCCTVVDWQPTFPPDQLLSSHPPPSRTTFLFIHQSRGPVA